MGIALPSTISSPRDVTTLIGEVQLYAKWHSQLTNASKLNAPYNEPQPEISSAALDLIRSISSQKPIGAQEIDTLITSLESLAKSAPVITITLAAPAPLAVKKKLVDWCREQIHPTVLITFQFNAALLGGMVVRTGSTIFDWSFRRALLERKTKFTEVLDRV